MYKCLSWSPLCGWPQTPQGAPETHLIDDLDFDFFLISNGLLLADLLRLHAHHLDQLVCVLILLFQLSLLNGQLSLQVVHLGRGSQERAEAC